MLHLEGSLYFYKKDEIESAREHNIGTGKIKYYGITIENGRQSISPHINFGDGILHMGAIVVDESVEVIELGKVYNADLFLIFVFDEAYQAIKSKLGIGIELPIQEGSRVIGKIKVENYNFYNDERMKVILEEQKKKRGVTREINFYPK